LGIFCTYRFNFCRVCDRTLRPISVGGPFPAQLPSSFNPYPTLPLPAGEIPSSREGDRYFGLRFRHRPSTANCILPFRLQNLPFLNPLARICFTDC
jgi:hypothetical protein